MSKLRMYMAYSGDPAESACLVFAHSVRGAKKLAWPVLCSWGCEDWTDMRVTWLRDRPWLMKEARSNTPHVAEAVTVCNRCERWGDELIDGICQTCRDEEFGGD